MLFSLLLLRCRALPPVAAAITRCRHFLRHAAAAYLIRFFIAIITFAAADSPVDATPLLI